MAVYTYEAVNGTGKVVRSTFEAANREDVVEMLKEKNLFPVKIEEGASKSVGVGLGSKKVKKKDLAFFCRQVSALLNAGIPIADTLQLVSEQIGDKKLKKAVMEISGEVQTGVALSESVKKQEFFPDLFVHMITAGEASGTLNNVMARLADNYESDYRIQKKVSGAMVYPILIVIVAVFAVGFIVSSVLPRFAEMFASANVALPVFTQALIDVSNILKQYWLYMLVALGAIVYGLVLFVRTPAGRTLVDKLKLDLPIIGGVSTKIVMGRFTRTLANLLKSGIPLIQALGYVAEVVGNKIIKEKTLFVREEVSKGANLTESVRKTKAFDPVVIHMIKIGEDSGTLDEVMESTAQIYDQEVEVAVQGLTSIIEPIMIIFMAGIVGVLVFSIITPMFDMAQTIGG